MITPIMFRTMPTRAISEILIRPLPNTMALGGVATGIINAQDSIKNDISLKKLYSTAQASLIIEHKDNNVI
jgi:hypothetical protein